MTGALAPQPQKLDEWVFQTIPTLLPQNGLLRPGLDDCAYIPLGEGGMVISTDFVNASPAFVELGIDADLPYELGYLAATASLSDVFCSGAHPSGLALGYMAPPDDIPDELPRFLIGAAAACAPWGVPIVGGDSKGSRSSRVASSTSFGWVPREQGYLARWNARPGQKILLSGPLGGFNAAVVIRHFGSGGRDPALVRDAILRPVLRPGLALHVAGSGGGAGIDISDGLASDASRVAETSGVALLIDVAALPVHPLASEAAPILGVSPAAFAFGTGGEWQHLVTVAPEALEGALAAGGILIGEVTDGPAGVFVRTNDGGRITVAPLGHSDGTYASFPEEIRDLVRRAERDLISHV